MAKEIIPHISYFKPEFLSNKKYKLKKLLTQCCQNGVKNENQTGRQSGRALSRWQACVLPNFPKNSRALGLYRQFSKWHSHGIKQTNNN